MFHEKKHNYTVMMLSSATSGVIARTFFHPLDTMKARLQVYYYLYKKKFIYYTTCHKMKL